MSQNCARSGTRDANNNTLYAGGTAPACAPRPAPGTKPYPQVTAKVLFGSVSAINDLKLQEKAAREARRTH